MANTKRKHDTLTNAQYDGIMNASRPSDAARAVGIDGKRVRDALRKRGVYVSKGHAFDDDAKAIVVAFASGVIARKASDTPSDTK